MVASPKITIVCKNAPPVGVTPAVCLVNPKNARNVAGVMRNCSSLGVSQLFWSGERVRQSLEGASRLPREERMKAYDDVDLFEFDRFLDCFDEGAVPVAVDRFDGAEQLQDFVHPERAVYVFGPEDGSIPPGYLGLCHRQVIIPSFECFNLAVATGIVLADRFMKRISAGLEPRRSTPEWIHEQVFREQRPRNIPDLFGQDGSVSDLEGGIG